MFLKLLSVYFWILFLGFCAMSLTRCEAVQLLSEPSHGASINQGGGDSKLLQLPFPAGMSMLCTQGAHGLHSHHNKSTEYGIDLDTSNFEDQEIYASVSGIAHVHTVEQTGSGFGTHLNIDRGDGTYVVHGHMKTIFVCDGCEVTAGQLIGFEGCTGSCTGDHVHLDLHSGDASLPAEKGVSIPATYLVTSGNTTMTIGSEEFVCGVGGDEPLGKSYTSALTVAYTHPDGTLVKTGHDAKVYVLSNGMRRWIADETVFKSLAYNFNQVVLVSDEELNCYADGGMISQPSLVDGVRDPNGVLWLVIGTQNAPDRFRAWVDPAAWESVLSSWGLPYNTVNPPQNVGWDHPYLVNWPKEPQLAEFRPGSILKEPSNSALYVASNHLALPIKDWPTYLMLGFLSRPIIYVSDGSVLAVETQMGDCASGLHCVSVDSVSLCGNNSLSLSDGDNTATYNMAGFHETEQATPPDSSEQGSQGGESSDPPPSSDQPSSSSTPAQPPASDPQVSSSVCPSGVPSCIVDADSNGVPESLLLSDSLWTATMAMHQNAYIYANGGCFDGLLGPNDLLTSVSGYYAINFSKFAVDCKSQLTLISSLTTDGQPLGSSMTNWLWWQNAAFCAQGSPLCNLMNNGQPWEEWLLCVSWNPKGGLTANGNGLTKNSQL